MRRVPAARCTAARHHPRLDQPAETLRKHVRQVEADEGGPGPATAEREEIKQPRNEVYELRRANEILKSASVFSPRSSTGTERGEPLHR